MAKKKTFRNNGFHKADAVAWDKQTFVTLSSRRAASASAGPRGFPARL